MKLAELSIKRLQEEIAGIDANALREAAINCKNETKISKLEKEIERLKLANQNLSEKLKDANLQLKESKILATGKRTRCGKAFDQEEAENFQQNVLHRTGYEFLFDITTVLLFPLFKQSISYKK